MAATVAPFGATPPPRISFSDLLTTVRVHESNGRISDSFLESPRGSVVFSVELDFAIGGNSLVVSLRGFRSLIVDPVSPLPGPSQGGDSVSCFLCSLVGGWVGSPRPPPRWLGLLMFACRGFSMFGFLPAAVVSSSFSLPTAPFVLLSRPLLPPPGFSPISSHLFSSCIFVFSPFSTSSSPCGHLLFLFFLCLLFFITSCLFCYAFCSCFFGLCSSSSLFSRLFFCSLLPYLCDSLLLCHVLVFSLSSLFLCRSDLLFSMAGGSPSLFCPSLPYSSFDFSCFISVCSCSCLFYYRFFIFISSSSSCSSCRSGSFCWRFVVLSLVGPGDRSRAFTFRLPAVSVASHARGPGFNPRAG